MVRFSPQIHTYPSGNGMFATVHGDGCELVTEIGTVHADRISAAYRSSACWMNIRCDGTVPEETQYLLTEKDGIYTLVFALADGAARTALYAEGDTLYARTETYDSATPVGDVRALYVTEGDNPYALITDAYRLLADELGTFSLREDTLPDFAHKFGFCTYNALGVDVTEQSIGTVLEAFRRHKIPVGFVIADDGWQAHDGNMLSGFTGDSAAFPDGLGASVRRLKQKYGVDKFLCWHTYNGYWQGLKAEAFPAIPVRTEYFRVPERFRTEEASAGGVVNTVTGCFYPDNLLEKPCGFVRGDLYDLYRPFYEYLASQGVDGSKLDAMAWIEGFSQGKGGRVAMTTQMVNALERASDEYFGGNHINCSSCTNDFFFHTHGKGVTRVSTDYFPDNAASYFQHIYSAATVCFWMQPVIFGDWDMFQSGVEGGELHAKCRAISGGPVYCSDNADTLCAEVIAPLVSDNGFVALCKQNAVPTRDCLFMTGNEAAPLKLFNKTAGGYVIGAFRCLPGRVTGRVNLSDIDGLPSGVYAVYSDVRGYLGNMTDEDGVDVTLDGYGAEIFTVVPAVNGTAILGRKNTYNPSGFLQEVSLTAQGFHARVIDDGAFLACRNGRLFTVYSRNRELTVPFADETEKEYVASMPRAEASAEGTRWLTR